MIDSIDSEGDDDNSGSEIIFAVDEMHEEHSTTAIIADITQDDAWIAIELTDAARLDEWQ